MVFAGDVAELHPNALAKLDKGLRDIGSRLITPKVAASPDSAVREYNHLVELFHQVGFQIRAGPEQSTVPGTGTDGGDAFANFKNPSFSRNLRLLHGLEAWRSEARQKKGLAAYETFFQLVKFRGINLDAPEWGAF
jgi:hypothetical protein